MFQHPCRTGLGLAIVLLWATLAAPTAGQDAGDVEAGARNFRSFCVSCHGGEGGGGRAPDLSVRPAMNGLTNAAILRTITNGRIDRGMPAWTFIPEIERRQLVAYIRSIDSGLSDEPIPGNIAQGARLFASNGGCGACHIVDGEGGTVGPDLSRIGRIRPPTFLRRALLEPNADLDPSWWSVRLVDHTGAMVEGRRMSEDTYTVRLLDAAGHLRAFEKSAVSSLENIEMSLMPSFDETLSAAEIDDLVAYLYSLRGN